MKVRWGEKIRVGRNFLGRWGTTFWDSKVLGGYDDDEVFIKGGCGGRSPPQRMGDDDDDDDYEGEKFVVG